jgi:hypothetical protein
MTFRPSGRLRCRMGRSAPEGRATIHISQPLRLALAGRYSEKAHREWQQFTAAASPDWPALAREAAGLGLAPLLYDACRRTAAPPTDVLADLHTHYLQTGLHNTLALRELARVLTLLNEAGIPVIVLKGAALAQMVYGNVALRPMVDLDLWLPFERLEEAQGLLASAGYVAPVPFPFTDESGLCWNELLLRSSQGPRPVVLELHWRLLDNPYYHRRLPMAPIWERSLPVMVEGVSSRVLAPDDLLLHLCSHNLYHHQGTVAQVGPDIGELLRQWGSAIPWPRFLESAQTSELSLAVQTTLLAAVADWYLPVPPEVVRAVAALKPRRRERFFVASQSSGYLKVLRTLLTLPGWRLKGRYLLRQLFPERSYLAWRYGAGPAAGLGRIYLDRFAAGLQRLHTEAGRLWRRPPVPPAAKENQPPPGE